MIDSVKQPDIGRRSPNDHHLYLPSTSPSDDTFVLSKLIVQRCQKVILFFIQQFGEFLEQEGLWNFIAMIVYGTNVETIRE
jgi:hypothetical protein